MKKVAMVLCVLPFLLLCGCATTYRVDYPAADDVFITLGDDPGTESEVPYTPKGFYYYRISEFYIPLPLLGLIPFGNASIDRVMYDKVLPEIRRMGGDSLTAGSIDHRARPHWLLRALGLGFFMPATTVVYGQVNKK